MEVLSPIASGEQSRAVEILLVEDNPGDVLLTREALAEGKVRNHLHVAADGVQAMAFLRREGEFDGAPRPDIILLDLNLPRKAGREVLAEIREDPQFAALPVAIITSSPAEEQVLAAYNTGVNCYINKPIDLAQFMKLVRSIEDFWVTITTTSIRPNSHG